MISSYSELMQNVDLQDEPQRLLFVFCRAELPDDATEEQKAEFERGEGGALTPVVCVDKSPQEVPRFQSLVAESEQTGQHWDLVFVAAMSGRGGVPPSSDDVQQPLTMMVESIRLGHVGAYLPLDRSGQSVALN